MTANNYSFSEIFFGNGQEMWSKQPNVQNNLYTKESKLTIALFFFTHSKICYYNNVKKLNYSSYKNM